jgi:hypothetical protein
MGIGLLGATGNRLMNCVLERFALAASALLILTVEPAVGAIPEEIRPPFGLQWGEEANRLEKLLEGAKAKIVNRSQIDGRDAWTVEGLVQQWLRRCVFYFKDGQLVEVELQYQDDSWDVERYDNFLSQVRRRIEQRYGVGQLIARSKAPQGEVMQTMVGYKWNHNNRVIQLIYYSAEQGAQAYRAVSVHYKAN